MYTDTINLTPNVANKSNIINNKFNQSNEIKMIDFKTNVIKNTNKPKFSYKQAFFYKSNKELLDFIEKQSIYIQVFGEQKHPKPKQTQSNLSTSEYFDKKLETDAKIPSKLIDPKSLKLENELNFLKLKDEQNHKSSVCTLL
jgi:hypothetical protein